MTPRMRQNLMKHPFILAGHQHWDSSVLGNVCGLWAPIFCHECSLNFSFLLCVKFIFSMMPFFQKFRKIHFLCCMYVVNLYSGWILFTQIFGLKYLDCTKMGAVVRIRLESQISQFTKGKLLQSAIISMQYKFTEKDFHSV